MEQASEAQRILRKKLCLWERFKNRVYCFRINDKLYVAYVANSKLNKSVIYETRMNVSNILFASSGHPTPQAVP